MIRGELTNLRAVERSDLGSLHSWFNDPELMRYWGQTDSTVSSAEIQRRIEDWIHEEALFGRPSCLMVETLDGEITGVVILSQFDRLTSSSELSLLIAPAARWGAGFGSDALSAIIDTCFSYWRLHRVAVRVEAFNERSLRLFERCGFQRDGVLRDASFFDGEFHDQLILSILSTDRMEDQGD